MGNTFFLKFMGYLKEKGLFFSLKKICSYAVFRVRKILDEKRLAVRIIEKGQVKISCAETGLKIFWKDRELTRDNGLNTSLCVLGMWYDSSQGSWDIVTKDPDSMLIRNRWKDLPVIMTWRIKIEDERCISWKVDMEVEEGIRIDERKAGAIFSSTYKRWINAYEEGEFPAIRGWEDIKITYMDSRCIGVRECREGYLPACLIDFSEIKQCIPQIQNSSVGVGGRILQVRFPESYEGKKYSPGNYDYFTGKVILSEETDTDKKIEDFREKLRDKVEDSQRRARFGKPHLKVLLANPPWKRGNNWGVRAGSRWPHIKDPLTEQDYMPYPFFLGYATSLLKKNGFEAELIDAIALKMEEEDFFNAVKDFAPDLIFSEVSTPSLYDDMFLLEKMKMVVGENINLVLAGPDFNIRKPEFIRDKEFINYVIVGEYETALLELCQKISEDKTIDDIKGIMYRDGKDIKMTPPREPIRDLDVLPWPYRKGLDMKRYIDAPGGMPFPSAQMWSSRGCAYKCIFCAWPQMMYFGNLYRMRSIKDTVDEMEYLVKDMQYRSIYFDDDTFNINRKRTIELANEVKRRNKEGRINVPWAIMARADLMDERVLIALKEAGLHTVKYGIESADQVILNKTCKGMDISKSIKMVKLTQRLGINTHLTFAFGLPGETAETIKKTIALACELSPVSVQFSIATPYPGTRYFEEMDKQGLIISKDWSLYDGNYTAVLKVGALAPEALERARDDAYTIWGEYYRRKEDMKKVVVKKEHITKFRNYIKEKGFLSALSKAISFSAFLVKNNLKWMNINRNALRCGDLKILTGNGKVKLFWRDIEITKDVGLNTSIYARDRWYDSSLIQGWKIRKDSSSRMVITSNWWKDLPIRQVWYITLSDDSSLRWSVEMEVKEEVFIGEKKAGILVSDLYKNWVNGKDKGEFPQSRVWEEIKLNDMESRVIMLEEIKDKISLPALLFDFSKSSTMVPQLQNTSEVISSRVLQAKKPVKTLYTPGKYPYFLGKIKIG